MRADRYEQNGRDIYRFMLNHFHYIAHNWSIEDIREWIDGEVDGGSSYEMVCGVIDAIKRGWADQ